MNSKHQSGFTVIELLAGMTLVVLMVLFLTKVFTDTSSAWASSTKRVESNMNGRTAVQFMARELAGAIASGNLTLKLESNVDDYLGVESDRIYFITTDQRTRVAVNLSTQNPVLNGAYYRQIKGVGYRMLPMQNPVDDGPLTNRFRIMRAGLEDFDNTNFTPYQNASWWSTASLSFNETLVENVRAIDYWVYDLNGDPQPNYDSSVHGPPAFVDIVLEMLGDSDARRLSLMSDADDIIDYADRAARRYFTRVYFHNLQGYALVP